MEKLQIADRILNDFGNERDVKRAKPKILTITKQLTLLTHIHFMDGAWFFFFFDVVIKYMLQFPSLMRLVKLSLFNYGLLRLMTRQYLGELVQFFLTNSLSNSLFVILNRL